MRVGTIGIVINELGQILLIKRDDSRTWSPPGGALNEGEPPPAGVIREVEEETGLKTMPVRLVGVLYRPERRREGVIFVFRNLVRGGTLQTSAESPAVGYASPDQLPRPMLGIHQQLIQKAYAHADNQPFLITQKLPLFTKMVRNVVFAAKNVRHRLREKTPYVPPFEWRAGAFTVLKNESGAILWVQRTDDARWNLPGGIVEAGEAPWQTAVRETKEETGLDVHIERLIGVYTKPEVGEIVFSFSARCDGGQLTQGAESAAFAYFALGSEPENSLVNHVARVQDAAAGDVPTFFKMQSQHS